MDKPEYVHGRDGEWADLVRFVTAVDRGALLGVVFGRRRQGKTTLLEALCERSGGFIWQARQQSSSQNLAELEVAIGAWTGTTPRLTGWEQAIDFLLRLTRSDGSADPLPVVIDEVGYLLDADPAFASRLQAALSPGSIRQRPNPVRLILCGSAFGQMRKLIDSGSPLRGRSRLTLVVRPFGYREAADYWGVAANPDLAFRLHALVGGTPAHREYAGSTPKRGDLDGWVRNHVLSASSPLMHEGRTAVLDDSSLTDRSLYWSVLGAIAEGPALRSEITTRLDRPPTSLHHALEVLTEAGWITSAIDPRRSRGARYEIDEPLVRLHRLVIEPNDRRLSQRGNSAAVWLDAQQIVTSQIYGPHLERLTREWMLDHASAELAGGEIVACGPGSLGSRSRRLDLDVLAAARTSRGATRICAVAECKSGAERVGVDELNRLDHAVDLLDPTERVNAVRRIIVARSGFTTELGQLARRRNDVTLLDIAGLYS